MWLRRVIYRVVDHQLSYYCTRASNKGKVAPLQERRMVDRFRVWAKGGDGGNGCCSYRRSRTDRYGKPDGGNGGTGGNVILECSSSVWDFSNLQHHINAKNGGHGMSKNLIGSRGANKVAQVPVGTVIHLVGGERPSFVKSSSITSLDPWDLPGTVEDSSCESVEQYNWNVSASKSSAENIDGSPYSKELSHTSCRHGHNAANHLSEPQEIINKKCIEDGKSCAATVKIELGDTEIDADQNGIEFDDDGVDDDDDEEEEEEVQYSVAELTKPGQSVLVALGGEGGLGNVSFGRDFKGNKAMASEDELSLTTGKPGSQTVLILELKSIADVGLVGMPNAGKSTLLGALSRANPAVGNYAFTTLRPNIGNLSYENFSVKVADIPGLIRGAHANRGLGHAFLRHIERTKVLAFVVDLAAALNGNKGIPPWEQLWDLVLELECHQEGLSMRPSLVVANKIDEEGAEEVYEELKRRVLDVPIFPVCAVLEEGIPELKTGLRRLMDGSETCRLNLDKIILE